MGFELPDEEDLPGRGDPLFAGVGFEVLGKTS